jgi:hypothetical protein
MPGRSEIGPDKVRTMVRSTLPSTARRWVRTEKRRNRRRARRRARQVLHGVGADGTTDAVLDLQAWQGDLVRERRENDKLNPFMRWCRARTRGLSDQEAVDFVRRILPRNLIGDHAFTHWEAFVRFGGRDQ